MRDGSRDGVDSPSPKVGHIGWTGTRDGADPQRVDPGARVDSPDNQLRLDRG